MLRSFVSKAIALVLCFLMLIGCTRSKHQRLAIAYVIDMTASVEKDAIRQAFTALESLLKNGILKRGDSIVIIPITGDALTEAQGKILRLRLPENRMAYDSDLTTLANDVEEKLKQMESEATANAYQRSDIIGTVEVAVDELSCETGNVRKVIVILSDLIQDDSRFNFNISMDLANDESAVALARKLSAKRKVEFDGTAVYLGLLRSKDLRKMPNPRREAVQAFWQEYFKASDAERVSIAVDGPEKVGISVARTD